MDIKNLELPSSVLSPSRQMFTLTKVDGNVKTNFYIRHDDTCGNGHNTFAMTCDTYENNILTMAGSSPCRIREAFPFLAPFLKWHLCSTDGPLHYIANTIYWVHDGNLDYARSTAIWPDATDKDLKAPNLEVRLLARLPELMLDFKRNVELLGLKY